jgi:hypothetical protein
VLSYAEYQFGEKVTGKAYRDREDGECISNFEVEVDTLHNINKRLTCLYTQENSTNRITRDNAAYPSLERSLNLLNPWLICLDSDNSNVVNSLTEAQSNLLLKNYFVQSMVWQL